METRSNHVLVGAVVLILLLAAAVFTVWLARVSDSDQKIYDIFFKQSVEGLAKGSSVSYRGVPVGQVDDIKIWKDDPNFVRVRISIGADVPVLVGTTATIQGSFTGVSTLLLEGAQKGNPPITEIGPAGAPVIPTKAGGLGALLNSAPQLLERLSTLTERLTLLLSDQNQASIASILKNVDRLSGSLADRGPEIAATLAETRVAVKQAGDAAEQIGKLAGTTNQLLDEQGRPLLVDLRETVARARSSMDNLDAVLKDARPGVQAFSKQTLPEVGLLVRDLRDMADALSGVAERLNRGGAGSLVGSRKLPDYEPTK
ncbi:MCE family protein [Sphingomonas sp. MAH-20]|uniref:MCE family protein n=1 Tax=Sphingomonas horti TaxID=2682842 RepID=A0A6I4IZA1_9SPHN|nr:MULTISPECIES: MlaD family protein [Sphingomonas]MBA2918520.1 MCE family protein [Sphingomonas sp. CGMCC 1.13658]MVO77487.1 MCE family protein [Sphingomonas horti]